MSTKGKWPNTVNRGPIRIRKECWFREEFSLLRRNMISMRKKKDAP